MALADLIQSTPTLATLADANDVAGIVAAVNEKTIEKSNPNSQSFWGYGKRYGKEMAYGLSALLDQLGQADIGVRDFAFAFKTANGLNLADPIFQEAFDEAIAGVPDQQKLLLISLKQMGVWYVSLAEETLGPPDVTEDQVVAALVEYEKEKAQIAAESLYKSKLNWLITNIDNAANARANAEPGESLADYQAWVKQLVEGL